MAKLELDQHELTTVLEGLHLLKKSAERAQKTGRTPQIIEVWKVHERAVTALELKISQAK